MQMKEMMLNWANSNLLCLLFQQPFILTDASGGFWG